MAQSNSDFSLVLTGRFAGKDRAVAQALARCFGRDDAWGLQVVGAAPITLLAGMTSTQAQAVYGQMVEIEKAGCRFEVQSGLDEGNPKVAWPGPIRVNGRVLSELGGSGSHRATARLADQALACPHCGQPIHVQLTAHSALQMMAHPGPATPGVAAPFPLHLPAPGGVPIPIPIPRAAPAAHAPAPPGAPVPLPISGVHPTRSAPPPVRSGSRPPVLALHPPAMDVPAHIQVDGLEELSPQNEGAPAPQRPLSPRVAQRPTGAVPLPEVPVVDAPAPPPLPRPTPVAMDPRMSGPMGLDEFEKGLHMHAPGAEPHPHPALAPVANSASGVRPDSATALKAVFEENPDAICSIFIGKSTNPKVHALVAEIQGTTIEEAQRLCQKPVVPIVKDIPVSEAGAIKERFLEINITPRVMIKR